MRDIDANQFMSYVTEDGFIYGFDIVSLYNLNINSGNQTNVLNPYTRDVIPLHVFSNLRSLLGLTNSIYNIRLDVTFEMPPEIPPSSMSIEEWVTAVFDAIDTHGHYTCTDWFMSLERNRLIRMLREMADIFLYRASLSIDVQLRICPRNPFRTLPTMLNIMNTYEDISASREVVLYVMNSMLFDGDNDADRALGAIFVLQALTLVSEEARASLPWFYESAVYT